ncbi:hypothetical protein PDE_03321 [Penicillium oxalicum 114-2]|uniref:Uncharacterized protein n=1 Tax=Penicillium oxalicum (strain 114-2 / CGMCC 5302) TaxID=933388 RepID=S7ZCM9_PENO1|nr:hypothetical protein PDE_03321 [Penicillium oxalicum 114-2]
MQHKTSRTFLFLSSSQDLYTIWREKPACPRRDAQRTNGNVSTIAPTGRKHFNLVLRCEPPPEKQMGFFFSRVEESQVDPPGLSTTSNWGLACLARRMGSSVVLYGVHGSQALRRRFDFCLFEVSLDIFGMASSRQPGLRVHGVTVQDQTGSF